jgi:DNA-binding NarL/FixJ family response regulator
LLRPSLHPIDHDWVSRRTVEARPPTRQTRVLLVDDHPLVRERLAELISREPDLCVCGEAEDRSHALETAETARPDLIIVDLTLKNSDGLELIKDVHRRWPGMQMLVVSMHDESLYAERVLRAGARGYITKQEAARDILGAIRHVLAGKIYLKQAISTHILDLMLPAVNEASVFPADSLADRELQVFELLGRGLTTRQIAQHLRVGSSTVETHRRRIRQKLKLRDRASLLQAAIAWAQQRRACKV